MSRSPLKLLSSVLAYIQANSPWFYLPAAGVCVAPLLDKSPAYVPFSNPIHNSISISVSANSLLISLVLFVHAAVATLSNEVAPTVKLPNGDWGTRAAVHMHSTSVLFVLFTRSVGSIVAEHPYGAMPSACEKTWFCTDWAHRGRDLLKAAREEKGAFCAYVTVASPRLRRTVDGRIVAVGGGSNG
jgi:hypothetical protein